MTLQKRLYSSLAVMVRRQWAPASALSRQPHLSSSRILRLQRRYVTGPQPSSPQNFNNGSSNSSDSKSNSDALKDKKDETFENIIKSEKPLHENGHCSLEDRQPEPQQKGQTKLDPAPEAEKAEKKARPQFLKDIKDLPSEYELRRSELSKWLVQNLDKLQTTIFTAGQTLNDFTGYSAIEKLKKSIEEQDKLITQTREEVRRCKELYGAAISNRSASQREVNELLQRKHAWSPVDLERFTELYRNDHANQHAEAESEANLNAAERVLEDAQLQMTRLISARYHEEQIWSDKIRRASTWGTWALMGFNIFLFIVVQLGLEPWKRRRLVGSFEEKVKHALAESEQHNEENNRKHAAENKGSEMVLSQTDTERLERLETLQTKTLQVLSTALLAPQSPATSTAVVAEGATPAHSSGITSDVELTWRTLPERLLTSTDAAANVAVCRPEEIAGLAGAGAVFGLLVGTLITLIVKS